MENLALAQLAKSVYDYCGLNYMNSLATFEMKILRRLTELKMDSLRCYISYLEKNEAEWVQLIELLTINETYFYREDKQLHVYAQLLSTVYREQSVNVWSAACSTGEEPYSLAIMAKNAGHPPEKLHILATDINQRVLVAAKKGAYNKTSLSFRRIPLDWQQRYFIETTTSYEVIDSIKEMVTFDYFNLVNKETIKEATQFDVIFCRNVFIYFDEQTIKQIVTRFYQALKPGGYLFLGHAETIAQFDTGFKMLSSNGTFYYRKE